MFCTYEEEKQYERIRKREAEIEAERAANLAAVRLRMDEDRLLDQMERTGRSTQAIRLKRLGLR